MVTYSKHVHDVLNFGTASRQDRADDFNECFRDPNVKMTIALKGGWSANEILPLVDWQLVAQNPKPLVGFSDITVLLNAIYAKTGNIGYLGPNFSSFGDMIEWKYTLNRFKQTTCGWDQKVSRSKKWGEHSWLNTHQTKPWKVLHAGHTSDIALGGNLGTFYLLQGTEYQPRFNRPFIFYLEDDDEALQYTAQEVARRFESLLQLPNFRKNLLGVNSSCIPTATW